MERRILFIVTFRKHDLGIVRTRRIYLPTPVRLHGFVASVQNCIWGAKHVAIQEQQKGKEGTRRDEGASSRNRFSRLIIRCIVNWTFLQWTVRLQITTLPKRRKKGSYFSKLTGVIPLMMERQNWLLCFSFDNMN